MISKFNLLIAGFLVYGVTAWFSAGYHHPDEHFQILELANYKLGGTLEPELPWEFQERIRPGLQPWLAFQMIQGMRGLGFDSPFTQTFVLRLCSGWLLWGVFWAWARQLGRSQENEKLTRQLLLAILLLWFMPYLSVRFSSENWAGGSFLAGLLFITQFIENDSFKTWWKPIIGGLLLGLSFFFRFQMAFALLGLGAWWLYYRKLPGKAWLALFLGGGLAVGLGMWADTWLYGEWAPTAVNYFQANIVEHKAANWGTSPWWYYGQEIFLTALPPVSLLLLVLGIWGGWKHRQQVFVWLLIPFILAHTLVAHKELRFLFSMVFPLLVLATLAWPIARQKFGGKWWAKSFWYLACGVNFLVLPIRCLTPANEALPCFQFLYNYAQKHPQTTLFAMEKNPYNLAGLNANFYQPTGMHVTVLHSLEQLDSLPDQSSGLLIYPKLQLPNTFSQTQVERLYSYFPDWIRALNVNNWQSRSRIWSIYTVKH